MEDTTLKIGLEGKVLWDGLLQGAGRVGPAQLVLQTQLEDPGLTQQGKAVRPFLCMSVFRPQQYTVYYCGCHHVRGYKTLKGDQATVHKSVVKDRGSHQ